MIKLPDYNSIIYGNKVAGINIHFSDNKKSVYSGLLLKKTKGNVIIEKVFDETESFEDFIKSLPAKIPVTINLTGKGILIRKIKKQDNVDTVKLVHSLIPNASPEDFFTKVYDSNSNSFVALLRNEQLKKIIEDFTSNNLFVTEINLGPFSLSNLVQQITKYDLINCSGYSVEIENNTIKDYISTNEENLFHYKVEETELTSGTILPFSSGLDFFILKNTGSLSKDVGNSKQSFKFFRLGKIIGMAGLIVLFSILLINFLLFDSYNKKVNDIQQKVSLNSTLVRQHDSLKAEYLRKKEFSEKFGSTGISRYSLYLDRLASNVPNKITLEKVFINPLLKQSGNTKKLEFESNKIIIEGSSESSLNINQYIKDIKKLKWIKEVKVINYKNEKSDKSARFTLEIITHV